MLGFSLFLFLNPRNTSISDVFTAAPANVSLRMAFQRDLNIKAFKQFEEVIRKFDRQLNHRHVFSPTTNTRIFCAYDQL